MSAEEETQLTESAPSSVDSSAAKRPHTQSRDSTERPAKRAVPAFEADAASRVDGGMASLPLAAGEALSTPGPRDRAKVPKTLAGLADAAPALAPDLHSAVAGLGVMKPEAIDQMVKPSQNCVWCCDGPRGSPMPHCGCAVLCTSCCVKLDAKVANARDLARAAAQLSAAKCPLCRERRLQA